MASTLSTAEQAYDELRAAAQQGHAVEAKIFDKNGLYAVMPGTGILYKQELDVPSRSSTGTMAVVVEQGITALHDGRLLLQLWVEWGAASCSHEVFRQLVVLPGGESEVVSLHNYSFQSTYQFDAAAAPGLGPCEDVVHWLFDAADIPGVVAMVRCQETSDASPQIELARWVQSNLPA